MKLHRKFTCLFLTLVLPALALASDGNAGDIPTPRGGSLVFDLSPGTGLPPGTLGSFAMTPVPFPGAPACTSVQPPLPTPGGGGIGTAPTDGQQRCVGAGWATWSNGYQGDLYYTGGPTSQTITLPPGTPAFYFYVQPKSVLRRDFHGCGPAGCCLDGELFGRREWRCRLRGLLQHGRERHPVHHGNGEYRFQHRGVRLGR